MNALLKTIALITAAGFPVAFSVQSFGLPLPALFDAAHMFGAFVVAVTVLTMLTEYTETKPVGSRKATAVAAAASRTALPLAA